MSERPVREPDEIKAALAVESPKWVDLRDRCERTGNLDAELVLHRNWAMLHLDHLLEELFERNVILGLEASHELTA